MTISKITKNRNIKKFKQKYEKMKKIYKKNEK